MTRAVVALFILAASVQMPAQQLHRYLYVAAPSDDLSIDRSIRILVFDIENRGQPIAYKKGDKFRNLGMYGESPDISGGFGQTGVQAIEKFLDGGGTLITTLQAVRYPIEASRGRSDRPT